MADVSVINDVLIEEDKESGTTHFTPIKAKDDECSSSVEIADHNWLESLADKLSHLSVRPYVKVRDLTDPIKNREDSEVGEGTKPAVEVGIKIDF